MKPFSVCTSPVFALAATAGASYTPPLREQLRNPWPDDRGCYIDEIVLSGMNAYALLDYVVRFELDRHQLCGPNVPFLLMGHQVSKLTGIAYPTPVYTDATATNGFVSSIMRWKLPKPLYLRPREDLLPILVNNALAQDLDNTVADAVTTGQWTYIGRALEKDDPIPATRCVPWVTSYYGPYREDDTAFSTRSTIDLINPYHIPMHVEGFGAYGDGKPLSLISPNSYNWGLDNAVAVRIYSPDGGIAVKSSVAPAALFHRFSWRAPMMLPPGRSFSMLIDEDYYVAEGAEASGRICFTMFGYHEVPL